MSKVPDTTTQPSWVEFLNTLPSPLTTALVGLAPHISRTRRLAQIVSWKSSWEESWIALALWWALCLLAEIGLRYCLPLAVVSIIIVSRWTSSKHTAGSLATEDTLQQTIADLTTLHALLPVLPQPHAILDRTALPFYVLARVVLILYLPYLFLTYFIRLRILIALGGTFLLTWRARWATLIRRALWRSAYIRWGVYRAWALLSGQPLSPRALSSSASASFAISPPNSSSSNSSELRFLFTVYENQRWWMGLDWTAALLPGERPAWCSPTLQPALPPSAFSLPSPSTVYLPSSSEHGKREKRTAQWRWAEPEWRVVVHKEGELSTRVEKTPPKEDAGGSAASVGAARMLRAAGKMREGSMSMGGGGSPERHTRDRDREEVDAKGAGEEEGKDEEMFTDADGWMYADNKWEGASARGGMGKYTRFRRWTRIAILSETVELVGLGEVGIHKDDTDRNQVQDPSLPTTATSPVTVTVPPDWQPALGRPDSLDRKPAGEPQNGQGEEDGLRRRLKAVVQSAGATHS